MELEQTSSERFEPQVDRRARVDEPPPVKVVAIADVEMLLPAGVDQGQLDGFYVELFQFERDETEPLPVYWGENWALRFRPVERIVEREDLRAQGIEVLSLAELETKLVEREMEYMRQRGLLPGQESILLQDPAGNWVEVVERRAVI